MGTLRLSTNMGPGQSGQAASVGYVLYSSPTVVAAARSQAGIAEVGAGSGIYAADVTAPAGWAGGYALWDNGNWDGAGTIYTIDVVGLALTDERAAAAAALLDLADAIETGITLRKQLQAFGAVLAGLLSGAEVNLPIFRKMGGNASSTPRVSAHTDANGNRTVITFDFS